MKTLQKTRLKHKYQCLRNSGKLHGTIVNAMRLRELRESRKVEQKAPPCVKQPKGVRNPILLQLGKVLECSAATYGSSVHPKYINWDAPEPDYALFIETHNHGRYSRSCPYTKYTYTVKYPSYIYVFRKTCVCYINNNKIKIKAPRGYHFSVIDNNACLVRNSDGFDYHFTASDVLFSDVPAILAIRKKLINNSKLAKEQAGKNSDKISNKELAHVFVCRADSYEVGNCRVGTSQFLHLHQLHNKRHVPALHLNHLAESITNLHYKKRILNAIRHAIDRTKRELAQGYSNLLYHNIIT